MWFSNYFPNVTKIIEGYLRLSIFLGMGCGRRSGAAWFYENVIASGFRKGFYEENAH
ncbi:MAG: hypothetical protein R6U85_13865 [Salinivirgaceae bacterium]